MTDEELYASLPPHKRDIWDGKTDHDPEVRAAYVARWKGDKNAHAVKQKLSDCVHFTGESHPDGEVRCPTCKNNFVKLKTFKCEVYGRCTVGRKVEGVAGCCGAKCQSYETKSGVVVQQSVKANPLPSAPMDPAFRMIAPSTRRKHVWRGGVIQIHVTRACDRSCNNCTQGSNLKGPVEFMSPELFRTACESLRDYFGVVGVFGGNPCLHPQFDELCRIMRGTIPWEQRGLWSNHPEGEGKTCAITFNPAHSNLNVHQSQEAYDEFARDWPDSVPILKGLDGDSRHSPPFVALKDVIPDETERWKLIHECDINKNWSAMIGVFRGELRAWFCEIAGAQSILHQDDDEYPDTGLPVVPGWWKVGIEAYQQQVRKHCHECGIPLKGNGALANSDETSQFSATHAGVYRTRGGNVKQVTELIQLGSPLKRVTDYIENGATP